MTVDNMRLVQLEAALASLITAADTLAELISESRRPQHDAVHNLCAAAESARELLYSRGARKLSD